MIVGNTMSTKRVTIEPDATLDPYSEGMPSRNQIISTPRGNVFLRDFCPAPFVERLRVDAGTHAFAHLPEREHQLLLSIARNPDCTLALAHTPEGAIVGQVTLAPLDTWWSQLENAYEIAIEVSEHWRGLGIARRLLAFALELETAENLILCALGLSWHWDIEGLHTTPHRYREMLVHLFTSQGFTEFATTESDITMDPVNVLLVRIGKWVDTRDIKTFRQVVQRPLPRWCNVFSGEGTRCVMSVSRSHPLERTRIMSGRALHITQEEGPCAIKTP
ncbi:hypothetical protein KSC_071110 [Ktedonobacter sp. SOSP1-52]|uniref:GNAT family N-acetyltransferase n=1 Tax=Ktedonobacter sp. SOSP1-52 TaxID=2778366 RepID=UPI001915535E|nr:GNAT family N-acetyltransferase [Ktedonobacter sp. SOSP1-52]GHO68219.1 hypothetical protein KSC_071110 [Ktedonobacter sp. SOSP1-52]